MELTKQNLGKLINAFIDVEIDTFIFKDIGREHYSISKFESVNTDAYNDDKDWKETVKNHLK